MSCAHLSPFIRQEAGRRRPVVEHVGPDDHFARQFRLLQYHPRGIAVEDVEDHDPSHYPNIGHRGRERL